MSTQLRPGRTLRWQPVNPGPSHATYTGSDYAPGDRVTIHGRMIRIGDLETGHYESAPTPYPEGTITRVSWQRTVNIRYQIGDTTVTEHRGLVELYHVRPHGRGAPIMCLAHQLEGTTP